jgi:protein-S-isoprenylcysteine O-methyltransferase Ste14
MDRTGQAGSAEPGAPGQEEQDVWERSGMWPLFGWIRYWRVLLTALFSLLVVALALLGRTPPARLLEPRASLLFVLPWALMVLGVAVRLWGSGNLRKNQEVTRTGVYQMVRHPLYLGSLAFFLAFFLSVGNPVTGAGLFLAMVLLVYYPTMIHEEVVLRRDFPEQIAGYDHLPRLLPNLLRLPEALRTDRFTVRFALGNLGLRSLGFLVVLPVFLELLRWVESRYR